MGDYLDLLKFLILKNEILVLSFSLQVALIELHLILIIFCRKWQLFQHSWRHINATTPPTTWRHPSPPTSMPAGIMHALLFFKGNCLRSNYSTWGGRICLEQLCKFFYDLLTRNVS